MPASGKSSLRSLARTSAVSTPSWSRTSSVSFNRAPRGTAIVSPASASTEPLLLELRRVDALDVERQAGRGQRPAEAPAQVVVAPAAADRVADGRVVDLEDGAGVVAQVAHQAEV